jgi:hypothetical protein
LAAYNATVTFGASVTSVVTALGLPVDTFLRRLIIEPLRANTHASWVGLITPNAAALTTSGVNKVQEMGIPTAGVALDRFVDAASGSDHNIDPGVYAVAGTAGEGCTISALTI